MNNFMKKNKNILYTGLFLFSFFPLYAQTDDDILGGSESTNEPVIATFKTSRIVNAQSIETVHKNELDLRITHRFGNIGGSSGGIQTFYGLDNASDIRIGFEYGITDKLSTCLARSKGGIFDSFIKYKFLQQRESTMPVTLVYLANVAMAAEKNPVFEKNMSRRFSYLHQLLLARKFSGNFSMEVIPSFLHRNFVQSEMFDTTDAQEAKDENNLFGIGVGFRYKFSRRCALLVDYFHLFSNYRKKFSSGRADIFEVKKYYAPLGIGLEIETGGHVFHITFTNATYILENQFLASTQESWMDSEFKFGFTISRTFDLGGSEVNGKR